jgi:hypothetical protein
LLTCTEPIAQRGAVLLINQQRKQGKTVRCLRLKGILKIKTLSRPGPIVVLCNIVEYIANTISDHHSSVNKQKDLTGGNCRILEQPTRKLPLPNKTDSDKNSVVCFS